MCVIKHKTYCKALTLLCVLILAACGGGNGNNSVNVNFPATPEDPSANADIASLSAYFGELSPEYNGARINYELLVPKSTTNISLEVLLVDSEATLTVNDIPQLQGVISVAFESAAETMTIDIQVTSADLSAQKQYSLFVSRSDDSENAELMGLEVSAGALSPGFVVGQRNYTVSVPNFVRRVTLTGLPDDERASMRLIMGGDYFSFDLSREIPIDVGDTEVILEVRAEDRISFQLYYLTFTRQSLDLLQETDYIQANTPVAEDRFGFAFGLDNHTLAIGAITADVDTSDTAVSDAGSVYVYDISSGVRNFQSLLSLNDGQPEDLFGWSVDIEGGALAVGAPGRNLGDKDNAGAVYVYQKVKNAWLEQAVLTPSNSGAGDLFGHRMALQGNWLAVSAIGEDSIATDPNDNTASNSGAVYLFKYENGVWIQKSLLKAPNLSINDGFGESLAIAGSVLLVGAPGEDSDINSNVNEENARLRDSGAVYVYEYDGQDWVFDSMIKAENAGEDNLFGKSVALGEVKSEISGEVIGEGYIAVGAPQENSQSTGVNGDALNSGAVQSGAVYLYQKVAGQWQQSHYLKASNTYPYAKFGESLATFEENLIVGSPGESSASVGVNQDQTQGVAQGSGAAYVFEAEGQNWIQKSYIKSSNGQSGDFFGTSVGINENAIIISAPFKDVGGGDNSEENAAGSAYMYGIQ